MRIDRVKFAAALINADLKGKDLAEKAGLSRSTVTAVRGGKSCSPQTAEKLAAGLGIPVAAILPEVKSNA